MSIKRPVHPILIALPLAAFAVTVIAVAAHAATGDAVWNRVGLFANLGGLAVALLATLVGVTDATNLPAFTVARAAGWRHVMFSVLGLFLFAATAIMIRHEDDLAPLALGALGLTAMAVAARYGRVVLLAYERNQTIVRYPARMRTHAMG